MADNDDERWTALAMLTREIMDEHTISTYQSFTRFSNAKQVYLDVLQCLRDRDDWTAYKKLRWMHADHKKFLVARALIFPERDTTAWDRIYRSGNGERPK